MWGKTNGKISSLICYSGTFYSSCPEHWQGVTGNLTLALVQKLKLEQVRSWSLSEQNLPSFHVIHTNFTFYITFVKYCTALTFDRFHLKISHYPNAFNAQWLLIISDFSLIIPQCQQHEIGFLSSVDIYGWDNQPLECRRSSSAAKKRTICKTMIKQKITLNVKSKRLKVKF